MSEYWWIKAYGDDVTIAEIVERRFVSETVRWAYPIGDEQGWPVSDVTLIKRIRPIPQSTVTKKEKPT